ncbi:MAG: hypothetical protein JWN45_3496 [Acidobacteriaceae bacterium]|jgi:hypothetical protein|nr:hypothetical protein [Acidobacteriaceae bacterium]
MKRFTTVTLFVFFVACFATTAGWAQNAHFISASSSLSAGSDPDDLVVSFKEAGLGNDVTIAYEATADGTATYACINGGGNHPSASNKETAHGPVTAKGTFSSGKNGSISAMLKGEEPDRGNFSCPGGQSLVLGSVSYTNVKITDTNNSIAESLLDVVKTFCDVNNLTKATVANCVVETEQ